MRAYALTAFSTTPTLSPRFIEVLVDFSWLLWLCRSRDSATGAWSVFVTWGPAGCVTHTIQLWHNDGGSVCPFFVREHACCVYILSSSMLRNKALLNIVLCCTCAHTAAVQRSGLAMHMVGALLRDAAGVQAAGAVP